MQKQRIRQRATIEQVNKGNAFIGTLEDNPDHQVRLTLSGRMHKAQIRVIAGDLVDVELSPYDLEHGRIVWHHS